MGQEQYYGLAKKPTNGLDYESIVAALARILPESYSAKTSANNQKEQEQYYKDMAAISEEENAMAKKNQTTSTGLGLATTAASIYGNMKNTDLMNKAMGIQSEPGIISNVYNIGKGLATDAYNYVMGVSEATAPVLQTGNALESANEITNVASNAKDLTYATDAVDAADAVAPVTKGAGIGGTLGTGLSFIGSKIMLPAAIAKLGGETMDTIFKGLGASESNTWRQMADTLENPFNLARWGEIISNGGEKFTGDTKTVIDILNPIGYVAELVGSFICTELHRQGYIDTATFIADSKFGAQMDKKEYAWYKTWGMPTAAKMYRSKFTTKIVGFFMIPVSLHMAHEVGVGKGSFFGKINFKVLQLICKIVD